MALKPTNSPTRNVVSYTAGAAGTRHPIPPTAMKRPPWKKGEQVRTVLHKIASGEYRVVRVWLEDRDHPGFVFRLEIDRDGQLVGFGVRPLLFVEERRADGTVISQGMGLDEDAVFDDSPRLTAKLIQRDVHIGRLHAAATRSVQYLAQFVPLDTSAPVVSTGQPARARRSSVSDLELAQFAADYRSLLDLGHERDVNERLAKRHHLSLDGVGYRIRLARSKQRALLTATTRGRPGGALTDKARSLLAAANQHDTKGPRQ